MDKTSTQKILQLLNILSCKEYTKNEIIEEFKKADMPIAKSLINKYIEQCNQNGFEIKSKVNNKRENVYYIEKEETALELSDEELDVISDVKKLLVLQKDYNKIRKTMHLFYEISKYIEDKDVQREFIDFGYYSTLNWFLVKQLEKHCEEKNLITFEYILPQGACKLITMHADSLKVSEWSQRLYLHGVFEGGRHFSHLPVDRIFAIKSVEQKAKRLDMSTENLVYTVSKEAYEKAYQDKKEEIIGEDGEKVTIERPADDEFYLIQRLLSFCPDLYYVSNSRIKDLFKEKLETLKTLYDDGIDR